MSIKVKEAIKTALAVVIVYGIALKTSWMNPYWGAFVVALIAMPSPGKSLQKGLLRLGGTIPGCIAAIVILALAPQSRWLFLALTCGWIFATTYLSLRQPKLSYLWFTAGLTTLVIGSSPESSEQLFRAATYRTLETDLGIMVYMLVSVFLWPRTEEAPAPAAPPAPAGQPQISNPLFDLDHFRGGLFAASATAIGFLVWVFFDPPGHAGWMAIPGALAMVIARLPQLRVTVFIKPLAIAVPLALAVYVFILPRLTTFPELAAVIFTLVFINLMVNTGIAQLAGNIAIINIIVIQNHQIYVFAPLVNASLFIFLGFYFVFALSYIMSSARPEKKLLGLVDRFFSSAGYLILHSEPGLYAASSRLRRWRIHHCRHDLLTLPQKMKAWGGTIDQGLFPGNPPEQAQELAAHLEELGQRLVAFFDAEQSDDAPPIAAEMRQDIAAWRSSCAEIFPHWSDPPILSPPEHATEHDPGLIGHCHTVTAATAAYATTAGKIDWDHWREERF